MGDRLIALIYLLNCPSWGHLELQGPDTEFLNQLHYWTSKYPCLHRPFMMWYDEGKRVKLTSTSELIFIECGESYSEPDKKFLQRAYEMSQNENVVENLEKIYKQLKKGIFIELYSLLDQILSFHFGSESVRLQGNLVLILAERIHSGITDDHH